jgi:hypothetical protein
MYDIFDLPVTYNDQELQFPARLQASAYAHRFVVEVYGQEVLFETDEEGSYRALVDPESLSKYVTAGLLEAIAKAIEAILR